MAIAKVCGEGRTVIQVELTEGGNRVRCGQACRSRISGGRGMSISTAWVTYKDGSWRHSCADWCGRVHVMGDWLVRSSAPEKGRERWQANSRDVGRARARTTHIQEDPRRANHRAAVLIVADSGQTATHIVRDRFLPKATPLGVD
jgi:hypothetical protein